jgi:hypothetical protein
MSSCHVRRLLDQVVSKGFRDNGYYDTVITCPVCRQQVDVNAVHRNRSAQRLIEGWYVLCPNRAVGCEEIMTVGVNERNLIDTPRRADLSMLHAMNNVFFEDN